MPPFSCVRDVGLECGLMLGFLTITALTQVRAVSREIDTFLVAGKVWLACAEAALPAFQFSPENFEAPCRSRFIAFVHNLTSVMSAAGLQATTPRAVDISSLCKHVGNARQAAASHRSSEGGRASYFVAALSFSDERSLSVALDKEHAPRPICAKPLSVSDGLGSGATLKLHFAFFKGVFLASCRDDGAPPASIEVAPEGYGAPNRAPHPSRVRRASVSLSLNSADPDVLIHYRSIALPLNGPWVAASPGMLLFTKGKAKGAKALTEGVLCVFCLRDGQREQSAHFAQYLNVDVASP